MWLVLLVTIVLLFIAAVRLACSAGCGSRRRRERLEANVACDATLRSDCQRLECTTTGDVSSATKQCAHCGPCVVAGAATCSPSMKTYCTNAECRTAADLRPGRVQGVRALHGRTTPTPTTPAGRRPNTPTGRRPTTPAGCNCQYRQYRQCRQCRQSARRI